MKTCFNKYHKLKTLIKMNKLEAKTNLVRKVLII